MLQPVSESKTGISVTMDTWLPSCLDHGETAPTGNPCATAGRSTRYDSGFRHQASSAADRCGKELGARH